ncbi:MAG: hypothetical protein AB1689_09530 [Thermodesulfobacteriota bacterium]
MPRSSRPLLVLAALCALAAACGDAGDGAPQVASVSGDAIPFNGGDRRIEGAEVWILEQPERRMVTGGDGHFSFDGVEVGSEVTLVLEHPDYHLIQTGTHVVPPEGIERLTFQAVTHDVYAALAALLGVVPDEEGACQMPTTVTRVGRSLYDPGAHGEEGATVTIDPPLPAEHGPIYFNSQVLPDRSRSETSDDGGVLWIQVPPGEYVLTASKPGVEFRQVKMKCRPGVLVNASPPWGLQALPAASATGG